MEFLLRTNVLEHDTSIGFSQFMPKETNDLSTTKQYTVDCIPSLSFRFEFHICIEVLHHQLPIPVIMWTVFEAPQGTLEKLKFERANHG